MDIFVKRIYQMLIIIGLSALLLMPLGMEAIRPSVYGCFGSSNNFTVSANSTTRPEYITATASVVSDTIPKSWDMIKSVMFRCCWSSNIKAWRTSGASFFSVSRTFDIAVKLASLKVSILPRLFQMRFFKHSCSVARSGPGGSCPRRRPARHPELP